MMVLDEMRDANLKRVASGIAGMMIVGALAACAPREGRFAIKNNAAEPIASASVLICGQTESFEEIDVQQVKAAKYRVTSDSHYDVKIEFRSGRVLERKVGYVTNDLGFDDEIIISDTDIKIVSKNTN